MVGEDTFTHRSDRKQRCAAYVPVWQSHLRRWCDLAREVRERAADQVDRRISAADFLKLYTSISFICADPQSIPRRLLESALGRWGDHGREAERRGIPVARVLRRIYVLWE